MNFKYLVKIYIYLITFSVNSVNIDLVTGRIEG